MHARMHARMHACTYGRARWPRERSTALLTDFADRLRLTRWGSAGGSRVAHGVSQPTPK